MQLNNRKRDRDQQFKNIDGKIGYTRVRMMTYSTKKCYASHEGHLLQWRVKTFD